jgi:hypothetical protein
MSPELVTQVASSGGAISVMGFVKAPGTYPHREGMTVEDALDEAGGYDACISCRQYFELGGHAPTYDVPPKVRRAGRRLGLPQVRAEWMRFILEPDDEIEFRHIIL